MITPHGPVSAVELSYETVDVVIAGATNATAACTSGSTIIGFYPDLATVAVKTVERVGDATVKVTMTETASATAHVVLMKA